MIAIVFDDMVQFYSMKNGLDALTAIGVPVDIIVPLKSDFKQTLLDETYDAIKKQGYSPIREIREKKTYKALLEPYRIQFCYDKEIVDFEYRIKYRYSLVSVKPWPVYTIEWNIDYDAVLCYTEREAEIFSAYGKAYIIAPMRYKGFHKDPDRKSDKPVLLYLPTFGDIGSIDSIGTAIDELKKDYYIIAKAHQATQHFQTEKERDEILKAIPDEYHDQTTNVVDLLKKADIVLSDNSSAVFDAIYTETPVAIYNNNPLDGRRLGNIVPPLYELVEEGFVPYTDDRDNIGKVLKDAGQYLEKQKSIKAEFSTAEDMTSEFVDVMKQFLSTERSSIEYYSVLDHIREEYYKKTTRIEELENELTSIVDSKTYKMANNLASPYRALKKKGKN